MRAAQPLVLAGAGLLGFYAGSLGVAVLAGGAAVAAPAQAIIHREE